jgi:hypothetical protein
MTTTRRSTTRSVAAIGLAIAVLLALRVVAWQPFPVPTAAMPDSYVRVTGVAHVHTTHSDGGNTVAAVASAAADVGLDFVIVTDHNTLAGKPDEGYGNTGVLTIVGTEISNHEGHLLAIGLPTPPYRFSGDGLDSLRDVGDLGGLAFVAHPENPRVDLRWTGWQLPGDWGLEILNGDSQWRTAGWAATIGAALLYPLNSDYALLRMMSRPTAALDRWDKLLTHRHVAAIAGADAHGIIHTALTRSLPLPTYDSVFRIAQNYVLLDRPLTGDATTDTAAIVAALGRGRAYVGVGALAEADHFFFVAERGTEQWTMGDTLTPGGPLHLRAGGALPAGAQTTLYRDGVPIAVTAGSLNEPVSSSGVFRVEVGLPGWDIPWIVSNPIYVQTEPDQARRTMAARLPEPVVAEPQIMLDRFDANSAFTVAADNSTRLTSPSTDPVGGPDGSPAGRIAFQLGTPNIEHPSPFVALVEYQPRDLSGRNGLVFSVRSDATYRLWIQVRDRRLGALDDAESWFTSVKTSTSWQTVTVPFSRLHSVDPTTDGTLNLAEIVAIVFLVDIGAVPPGTDGVIWFDDLGVY